MQIRALSGLALAGILVAPAMAIGHRDRGKVVVANRASGDLAVIDVATDQVTSLSMPAGANPSEPMYVVHTRRHDRLFVGDRANNRVAVFRGRSLAPAGTVPTGNGVFHMWANPQGSQLWVNNDVDNTATVIDVRRLAVRATVPMPQDLVALGGKPHDVVLDTRFAYITMVGFAGPDDFVVKFSQRSFREVGRAAVGKDPHVTLALWHHKLHVPAQNSDKVTVLNRRTMTPITDIAVPGAHGAWTHYFGRVVYTTNLPGGGTDGLFAIDVRSNTVLGSTTTPFAVPHNIVVARRGGKLYCTHSGAASDKVTVYRTSFRNPVPVFVTQVDVGLNPFGLAYLPH